MTGASERRLAPWVLAVVVSAATVLVLLVAVWASVAGPDEAFRGSGPDLDRMSSSEPPPPTSEPPPPPDAGSGESETNDAFTTVLIAVVAVLALVLLGASVAALVPVVPRLRRWRRPPPRDDRLDVDVDPVGAVATAIVDDARTQEELLLSGPPRNGVVLCWHRFEVQAERAGVPREPWETSSEFTLRLLDLVEADASAVGQLAAAYREARFSEHDLGEDARLRAQESLLRIHRDLRTLLSGGRR